MRRNSYPYAILQRWLPWLVWVGFLLLYSATAAPSIVELFDDSLEFQMVVPTLGIAHPTGYPLYGLLGGLWSRLLFPIGNWAWRMNIFSALAAATTLWLLFLLPRQLTAQIYTPSNTPSNTRSENLTGLIAAFTFGLMPLWWAQATIAEVYALHNLLIIASLYVAFMDAEAGGKEAGGRIQVTWLCGLIGLALAHHRTAVLLLPGLALYLVWSQPTLLRPQWAWLRWLAALCLPLLLYLWLPLRASLGAADLHGSYVNSWAGFWDHVLARQYQSVFFGENPLAVTRTWEQWGQLLGQQLGIIGTLLAMVGLLSTLLGKDKRFWLSLLLVLVVNLLFAVNYKVHDAETYLLPVLLCLALFAGAGFAWLAQVIGRVRAQLPVYFFLVLLITQLVIPRLQRPLINRSQVWDAHDYAVALAKVDFPPGSQVIALEGEATALLYMQQATGFGRMATPVVADDPTVRLAKIEQSVVNGDPTYVTRELSGLAERYSFSGDGPLVRVWPRGKAQPGKPQYSLLIPVANGALQLTGYDLVILAQAGGPSLQVAFYWQPQVALTQTLKLSLRLQTLATATNSWVPVTWLDTSPVQEDRFPLRQVASSEDWLPGEVVRDVQILPIPTIERTQPYRLQVIVYNAVTIVEVGQFTLMIP